MTLSKWLWPILCLLAALSILLGILHVSKSIPVYWSADMAQDILGWAAACVAVALLIRWLLPSHARATLLAVAALYLAIGVGAAPAAATVLVLASCWCCGSLALQAAFPAEGRPSGLAKPLLVGLACELALFGALIHLPVNSGARYMMVLALPILAWIALRRPRPNQLLAELGAKGDVLADVPFWLVAVAVAIVGVGARYAFLPTVDYDNNSEHLRLWTELAAYHRFSFNVLQQAWNVEPFAVDLIRAIPSLVAGSDAHTAMGLALLALLLRQMWAIGGHLGLRPTDRVIILVLFASTPMAGWLVFAMQAELFLALLAAAGVRFLLDAKAQTACQDTVAVVAIAALCCATKAPGAALGLLLLLAGLPRLAQAKHQGARLVDLPRQWPMLLFILVFAVTALGSYVTAWRITGNPLFPLYNSHFKSPFFPPQDFSDRRWMKGFSLRSFYGLFFRTAEFHESKDYTAGFQYLFLLPLGLLALPWRNQRSAAVGIALPLAGFGLLMFSQTQYMRYLFPILPLASLAIGALFVPGSWTAAGAGAFRTFAAFCVGLNLFFLPGISYIFGTPPQAVYGATGKARSAEDMMPAKALVDALNVQAPGESVLFPADTPLGASLKAEPLYVNWYASGRQARFAAIHDEADVGAFLRGENAKHVVVDTNDASKPGEPAWLLHAWLTHNALPELISHNYISYAVQAAAPAYHAIFDLQQAILGTPKILTPDGSAALIPSGGLKAGPTPLMIARAPTNWARIMRYHAQFQCASAGGYFIAQVNWDRGAPYYRLVRCADGPVEFEEAFPIPGGASLGTIIATSRETSAVTVSRLTLETN